LVKASVGNDTPKKKPNITPTKVVTISLIVSFGFRIIPLYPKRCPCYELYQERQEKNRTLSQQKNTSQWFLTCEREFPY
jgi:cytochrome c oxidase assembly protein Cox11